MQYTVDGVPADLSGSTLKKLSVHRLFVLLLVTMMFQVTVTTSLNKIFTMMPYGKDIITPDIKNCDCVSMDECKNSFPNKQLDEQDLSLRYRSPCAHNSINCCKTNEKTPEKPITPKREMCGHWNPMGIGYKGTTNDFQANYGEFPWMIVILKLDPLNQTELTVHCGGSLIHPKVVLTSANCIRNYDPDELLVRGGEWDLNAKNEFYPIQDRQIMKKIVHSEFNSGNGNNNVALIIVKEPFILTHNLGTICLPSQNTVFDNRKCYTSGWGKYAIAGINETPVTLKKIILPIVSSALCSTMYKQLLGSHFNFHESNICAGEKGKDTCKGDGGGPLMCSIEGKSKQYQQAGIVSWGHGCDSKLPGMYANVALFRNWIDEHMDNEKLKKDFYDPKFIPDK